MRIRVADVQEASETLWNNAATEVEPGTWPQHKPWILRLGRLQHWQRRCFLIARAIGAKDPSVSDSDVAELDEALGEVSYSLIQRVPPQFHGKCGSKDADEAYKVKCCGDGC